MLLIVGTGPWRLYAFCTGSGDLGGVVGYGWSRRFNVDVQPASLWATQFVRRSRFWATVYIIRMSWEDAGVHAVSGGMPWALNSRLDGTVRQSDNATSFLALSLSRYNLSIFHHSDDQRSWEHALLWRFHHFNLGLYYKGDLRMAGLALTYP